MELGQFISLLREMSTHLNELVNQADEARGFLDDFIDFIDESINTLPKDE